MGKFCRLLLLLACSVLAATCGTPTPRPSEPAASPLPTSITATPCASLAAPTAIGDTADHTIAGIFVEGTLHFSMGDEDWAARAYVVQARLAAIGKSSLRPGEAWPSTEIVIDIEQNLRGSMTTGRSRMVVSGDLNDCHYSAQPDRLRTGLDYLFIFDIPGSSLPGEWLIEAAWPVDGTDEVQTAGGPMTLVELQHRLDAIPIPSGFIYPLSLP
jgi:hypothetical protein